MPVYGWVILSVVVVVIAFFLCRELFCWYFKINNIVSLLETQNNLLERIVNGGKQASEGEKQADVYVKNNFANPYIVITGTSIKETPDINANDIIEIKTDEITDFTSEAYEDGVKNIWYKVRYKQHEGWCLSKCIKKYNI